MAALTRKQQNHENRVDLKTVSYSGAKLVGLRGVSRSKLGKTLTECSDNIWKNDRKTVKRFRVNTLQPSRFRCDLEVMKPC